jgi:5-methylcytosine-specific restriction endonuclease McrA
MNELLVSRGNKPRTGTLITCPSCSVVVYKSPSQIKPGRVSYCSPACYHKGLFKGKDIECGYCGVLFYRSPSLVKIRSTNFCSVACMGKQQGLSQRGENNPLWRGGVSKEAKRLRASKEFKEWRKAVFERDNFTCQFCGIRGGYLEPDHIKPFAYYPLLRFDITNGRTLCRPCHKTTETFGSKGRKLHELEKDKDRPR